MHLKPGKSFRPELVTVIVAMLVFLIGVLVYSIDRQPAQVYFMSDWMSLGDGKGSVFGILGQHLPTFVHVYTFILLTMALVVPADRYRKYLLPVCLGWFALDSLFEIAQLDAIGRKIADWVPDWFAHVPFLENTASYFIVGTFDVLDLLSIALGTLAAYLTMRAIIKRSTHGATAVDL
ncbi:hypothetical protein [Kaarinaea lacus]